ncbi:hypothetical protein TrVE_jg806 [Triparma verrucosa]|uniref:VWFA domain-containing protein n=2 Tax=Triparma TaxID=722752 RepID=A0A9W7EEE6_9STRA|nr:hypothetical protein TrST_g2411 [Triparma strigata]GMH95269.1 hypothetical protein TrVE_jg806 [Triparma verrucosa]
MINSIPTAHAVAVEPSAPVFTPSHSNSHENQRTDLERKNILREHYPSIAPGLADQFVKSCDTFGSRFWIVDNSGSMATSDGHVMIEGGMVTCSRWEELGSTICWHAEMSSRLQVPTEFRLLNPPPRANQVVTVGEGAAGRGLEEIRKACSSGPTGRTPLCSQIRQVVQRVRLQESQLRAEGKMALVVIASDGASTDGDVAAALRPLQDLPAWVVIRLCTDDDSVVEYWNEIDEDLEMDMDVLDDLCGEASEVTALNPWLTYAPELHRLREFGTTTKSFDLLDERPFLANEVKDILQIIFGSAGSISHPDLGVSDFVQSIEAAQKNCSEVYNPVKKRKTGWVDVKKLRNYVKSGGCTVM